MNEDAARRACVVSVSQRGADERREPIPQRFRTGRRVYKAKKSGTTLRDAQGSRVSDPGVLDGMLWSSRSRLWPSTPDCPGNAQAIIDQYALGRARGGGDIAIPGRRLIAQQILRAGGAAAGLDGKPYEVFHFGVEFVVCLLGQGFHAAAACEASLCLILGLPTTS